jgi:3-hydroxymyristoyl/3-hydroxydecanoyl-(acyl carrier protein) dehydratase
VPTLEITFPIGLPAVQGHFPNNPIVPGAVLLAETLHRIGAALDAKLMPGNVKAAKFFRPVRPGEKVEIEYTQAKPGEVRFTCMVAGQAVMSGQVQWP